MHAFTILFAALLCAGLALDLWLLRRQVATVRAHRDTVPAPFAASVTTEQHRKAADYATALARQSAVASLWHAALLLLLTIGGGIAAIDAALAGQGFDSAWRGVIAVAAIGLLLAVAGLPLAAWRTFGIEARFGFNRTTPLLFAIDHVKGLAIAALLLLPLVALLLWLMGRAGSAWWLWAFGAWAVFSLALAWVWPRLIAPMFNRFHELEPGALRERIDALVRRCGFTVRGVRIMDGSRRSSHGNAYFTGIGSAKRVVFFDTLLESLAPDEVEAVLAHELGHYRLRHVAWGVTASLAGALAGCATLGWLARQGWFQPALGVPDGTPHTLLLLFALAAPVFLQPFAPIAAWLSRRREFAADRYAARHADGGALARALVKLYRDNATTLTPDALYTAFNASHPPALQRIGRLMRSAPA